MPDSRQFDVRYLDDLNLPFDRVTKELSDELPRLVDGENMYVTIGGKLSIAPGLNNTGLTSYTLTKRPDRLVIYETLESPPKVYLLASVYNSSTGFWEMYYLRLDAASPAWTIFTSVRDVNASTRPHEIITARGLAFIKSFPGPSGDKYGSVIFDGTVPAVRLWGLPTPTVPARRVDPATWAASKDPVTVNFGWKYVYAWKSVTGQYSNRSDLESDPSQNPSDTGAFKNKKPQVVVQGHADTINIPKIGIFRTTDGGGTFYHLEDIINTGAGDIIYTDDERVAGTGENPKTDAQLDTTNIAPSRTSNTVPPPCEAGGVIGTTAVAPSTNLAHFARRIWYGIGNRIVFSGDEEILNGVPEESFPNPLGIRGNYYLVRGQPRVMKPAKNALYSLTSDEILCIRGSDRASFTIDQIVPDIKMAQGHPRAAVSFRDGVFFLTSDLQIALVVLDNAPQIISEPLGDSLRSLITTNVEVAMEVFSRDGNVWLIVAVINKTTPANTRVFVYDLKKRMWFTPWSKQISAMAFGRLKESDPNDYLVVMTWDGTTSALAVLDLNIKTDLGTAYAASFTTNLFTVPPGNHINQVRQPAHHPMLSYLVVERTKFAGDTDPTIEYRLDEFSGPFNSAVLQEPPFITQPSSHSLHWCPVQKVCKRVQLKVSKTAVDESFEIQNLGFVFMSEAGG